MKVKLMALIGFVILVSIGNAQNDTMYIMKNGSVAGKYDINQQIDSIIFYNPTSVTINTFTDPRDGKVYKFVSIGTQVWMAENLNYQASNSWCYDNNTANCDQYGRLYDWSTALNICPQGWHLPTDEEWCTLTTYVDNTVDCNVIGWSGTDAGYKLKNTSGWYLDGNGSNAYGFSALPGGYRFYTGEFTSKEQYGFFWSKDNINENAWNRGLANINDDVYRIFSNQGYGFSVRCLRD